MSSEKLVQESFRTVFRVVDKEALRWFPGHMNRGLKQMQHKLRSIDCIVEVHDARIPLSGRNIDFKQTISGVKPHILVLNKVDLINRKYIDRIIERLSKEYEHIIFTNAKEQGDKGVRKIMPLAQELIGKSERYNRAGEEDFCMMVIGVPNVGKSSVINALRHKYLKRGNATQVGASPGITRSVMNKIKISEKPLFYLIDTPGILTPNIPNTEIGLKLALCATLQDHLVGENILADYLLYWMNKNQHFQYVKYFGLKEPEDNILNILAEICRQRGKTIKFRDTNNNYIVKPNLDEAAKIMVRAFRNGDLGKICLDEDLLK